MDRGQISVIVPVYNSAAFIKRCVNSITDQTYKNLEIILIDDGSTDDSAALCDKLAEKDKRIVVFHKPNEGPSAARNLGIEKANGKYLGFVDSDDYLDPDMYEVLLSAVERGCDFSMCGRYLEYPENDHKRTAYIYVGRGEKKYTRNEALKDFLIQQRMSKSVCEKLFKRELFDDIRFPLNKNSEDIPVIYKIIRKSNNVIHIGVPKYHNYCRTQSRSRDTFNISFVDQVYFARDILKDITSNFSDLYEDAVAFYSNILGSVIYKIEEENKQREFEEIYIKLKEEYSGYKREQAPPAAINEDNAELIKLREFYKIQTYWLFLKAKGHNLSEYFRNNNYHRVAIYGMKELGEILVKELADTDTKVVYGIDRNAETMFSPIELYLPEENLPEVDVIVVTAIHYFDEIQESLRNNVKCPVISVEDVLCSDCFY